MIIIHTYPLTRTHEHGILYTLINAITSIPIWMQTKWDGSRCIDIDCRRNYLQRRIKNNNVINKIRKRKLTNIRTQTNSYTHTSAHTQVYAHETKGARSKKKVSAPTPTRTHANTPYERWNIAHKARKLKHTHPLLAARWASRCSRADCTSAWPFRECRIHIGNQMHRRSLPE